MPQLAAEVLGPLRVVVDGVPIDLGGPRQRRLLGALLVEQGSVVSTDRLIEAVFDGEPPDAASRTFRTYVARLRRALELAGVDASAVLVTESQGYLVPTTAMGLDARRFEEALGDAHDRLAVGDPDGSALVLDEALSLWAGPAYGEFADEEWARVEATRLRELRVVAEEMRAEAVIESGHHAAIIPNIEALIEQEPFREEPRRLLMLALYRAGRHVDALRAGREYRRFLADETGLEPSHELDELEQLIVDQDPRLEVRPRGKKLRGYLLGAAIAESELGTTYRASQPSVGRDVAVIVIPAEQADDPEFVRRFEVYAQRIASIEHPNVVPLYDYWREPGGAYLVTRFLAGGTLEARLGDVAADTEVALNVVRDVGSALNAAHERGVTHGQLSSSRVMFDDMGTAYVTGFALASDRRTTPVDIAALGDLAAQIWRVSAVPEPESGHAVAVATRVAAVVDRAHGARTEPPFPTISDLVMALETAVRGDEPTSTDEIVSAPTIEGPNPYRGLNAFVETDADVFFGRERVAEEMIADLNGDHLLALVGPSGSGKSSVVRAGLLPALRARGAFVATMVPGNRPLAELEIALSRVAMIEVPDLASLLAADQTALGRVLDELVPEIQEQVVLVIDQFEEAFTISDPDERDLFLSALAVAARQPGTRLRVVVTLRADFLGPALDHPVIGSAIRDYSRLLTPLDPDELHAAIVGPAESSGVAVESALATALVADATTSAGSLPLLQYALTELYEHRADGTMTLNAYRRLGGIGGVLSQRAEEIFTSLDVDDQVASRRLFSRLINPGEGAEDTRRRALRSELTSVSDELLATYAAARLVSFDRDPTTREPTIEVTHEALIREWPRLRQWISDDRDGLRLLRHLTAAAGGWDTSGREDGELYRGARLEAAEDWAVANPGELSAVEQAFVDDARARRDADAEQERRRVRRLRSLLVGVGVVAVIALVAGAVAFVQKRSADESAAEADLRRVIAESQVAIVDDPNRALLLGLEAYRVDPSFETLGAVQRVGAGTDPAWLGDIANGVEYRNVAFLPDGSLLAVHENGVEVWDVAERVLLRSTELSEPTLAIDLSADGRLLALGSPDGSWRVLGTDSFDETAAGSADAPVGVIRIGADDDLIVLGLRDGAVVTSSIATPDLMTVRHGADSDGEPYVREVADVAIREDGEVIAAAWGLGNSVHQWSVTSGGDPLVLEESVDAYYLLYDEDRLYTAFREVDTFDSTTGEPIGAPIDRRTGLDASEMTRSGESELVIFGTGSIETVDLADGSRERQDLESGTGRFGVSIAPDGDMAAVGTSGGIAFWALDGAGAFVDLVVPAPPKFAQTSAISADGTTIVQGGNASDDISTLIWENSGSGLELVHEEPKGRGMRVTGNDVIMYGGHPPKPAPAEVITFDHWSGEVARVVRLMEAERATFGANIPVFTPDGEQFVHPWNFGNGIVDIYDVASGERLKRLTDVQDAVDGGESYMLVPVFTPDVDRLVTPSFEQWVAVYDPATWDLIEMIEPEDGFREIVFMPDGQRVITLSEQGLEIRDADDLRTVLAGPVPSEEEPGLGRVLEITTDGRYLKTSGVTGAQLWDPETLQPIGGPFPDDVMAWGPTLASDTNQLATTIDGAMVVWNIDLDEWPELACLAAGRNLTRAEWEQFGPAGEYHVTCDHWPSG